MDLRRFHDLTLMLLLLLVTCLGHGMNGAEFDTVDCPDGSFMPVGAAECQPCSGCPENKVVRETCSGYRDTVCGPFTEFQMFQSYKVHENSKNKGNRVPDNEESDRLYVVTVVMTVLLALTSVVCVTIGALICYKRFRDKKEGLMNNVDKGDSEQPSCSDWLKNHGCRRRPPSVSTSHDDVMNAPSTSTSHVHQFEIVEGDAKT